MFPVMAQSSFHLLLCCELRRNVGEKSETRSIIGVKRVNMYRKSSWNSYNRRRGNSLNEITEPLVVAGVGVPVILIVAAIAVHLGRLVF